MKIRRSVFVLGCLLLALGARSSGASSLVWPELASIDSVSLAEPSIVAVSILEGAQGSALAEELTRLSVSLLERFEIEVESEADQELAILVASPSSAYVGEDRIVLIVSVSLDERVVATRYIPTGQEISATTWNDERVDVVPVGRFSEGAVDLASRLINQFGDSVRQARREFALCPQ